ncbi:hypothetical protein Q5691_26045 [Microcoleus sp. w1-18aA5]
MALYFPLSAIAPELSTDRTLGSILEESGVCSSLKYSWREISSPF